MITLEYSFVIEATADPAFFGIYAPDLPGFTGVGISIEDHVEKAGVGMSEHVALLLERGMPVPSPTPDPRITIHHRVGMSSASQV